MAAKNPPKKASKPPAKPRAVVAYEADLQVDFSPDPRNANKGTKRGAELLGRSVAEFGAGRSMVADKAGRIVAGNKSRETMLASGTKRAIVVETDGSTPVIVKRTDFDLTRKGNKARRYAFADNRAAELNLDWDPEVIKTELGEGLKLDDMWDLVELNRLLGIKPDEVTEDGGDVSDPPDNPVTQPGDIWILGDHRLMCGDSTDAESLARLMDGETAGLMATDPPYGVDRVGGDTNPKGRTFRSGKKIANDKLQGPALEKFLASAFTAAAPHLAPGAAWYVWYAGVESQAFMSAAKILGGEKHILIWVKPNFVFGRCDYHYRHEPCLYGWMPGAAHVWLGSRDQSTVFDPPRDEEVAKLKHPTVKPVKLYAVPMQNHLEPGGIVLDIFAGSGPAFSAAEQLGMKCRGMELDPGYCDVIVERWEKLSGKKAKRQT